MSAALGLAAAAPWHAGPDPTGTPAIDFFLLLPVLAPAVGALLVLLIDAVRPQRAAVPTVMAVLSIGVGLGAAIGLAVDASRNDVPTRTLCLPAPDGACLWTASPATGMLQAAALATALAAVLLLSDRLRVGAESAVTVALLLAATAGATGVVAARDIGSWLVLLELATLPVIGLVALRPRPGAGHSALSLLLTSLLSFGLLVLGVALWVTATGDPTFAPDSVAAAWLDPGSRAVLLLAVLVLLAGLGFKLSLVPFHAWTPQVFANGSLPAVTLLAGTSKLAAVGALITVLQPFTGIAGRGGAPPTTIRVALLALALASMLLGTVVALRQVEVLRLLAWSTIAQAGWVVLPLVALTDAGLRASAVYAIVYAAAAVTALGCVSALRAVDPDGPQERAERAGALAAYAGLLRTRPWVAGPLALALLVLAGLPPGIIGLVAKVTALRPVVDAGWWPLAVVAVVAAVLGVAVYLRWLAVLFAWGGWSEQAVPRWAQRIEPGARSVMLLGAVVLVALSVLPQLLLLAL